MRQDPERGMLHVPQMICTVLQTDFVLYMKYPQSLRRFDAPTRLLSGESDHLGYVAKVPNVLGRRMVMSRVAKVASVTFVAVQLDILAYLKNRARSLYPINRVACD
jgi:hypothetical protein